MTYWSRFAVIWRGFGSFCVAGRCLGASSISSSMISWHRLMHSSQMYTPWPAMSLRTCSWLLPQNEQRYGTLVLLFPPVALTPCPRLPVTDPPGSISGSGLRLLLLLLLLCLRGPGIVRFGDA